MYYISLFIFSLLVQVEEYNISQINTKKKNIEKQKICSCLTLFFFMQTELDIGKQMKRKVGEKFYDF